MCLSARTSAQALPTLQYTPPASFYRSASTPPDQYASQEVNAGMQVYPFRAFGGDFQQAFRQGMFRDWLDAQFREENVATAPQLAPANVPGVDAGIMARFSETVAGTAKPHLRIALLSKGAVAIVDVQANSDGSFQRAWPALQPALASLRVVAPNAAAAGPPAGTPAARAAAATVSGLFMGTKPRYVVDLQRGVGYGRWVTSPHWYLFSGDGRVHRGYDDPGVPNGDVRRFDFDRARQTDSDNSGVYTVKGGQLILEMGTQGTERILVPLPTHRVVISTVVYYKQ